MRISSDSQNIRRAIDPRTLTVATGQSPTQKRVSVGEPANPGKDSTPHNPKGDTPRP